MKNAIPMIAIIAVGILIAIVDDLTRKSRLLRYWRRPCMGPDWRRDFPDVPKDDIRSFLNTFVNAFMFKSKNRLKFSPSDKVMDVYRTVYPPGSAVDALEIETFARTLQREYGVDLAELTNPKEITLGQVFEMTRNPNKAMHQRPSLDP